MDPAADPKTQKYFTYRALLDTGAMGCAISKNVVRDLAIDSHRNTGTVGIHGTQQTGQFFVSLGIPVGESEGGTQVKLSHVLEVSQYSFKGCDFDVLIGMSILQKCHFVIHSGDQFTLCIYPPTPVAAGRHNPTPKIRLNFPAAVEGI